MDILGFGAAQRKPAGIASRVILGFGVLCGALLFGATTASADCTAGFLGQPTAAGAPLVVSTACRVKPGTYIYGAVNIISGGQLIFDEGDGPGPIDFWASSIIIENKGALLAQNSKAPITTSAPHGRFGSNGSILTLHLWGANASKWNEANQKFDTQNQGALCKTPIGSANGPCGLPTTGGAPVNGQSIALPGGYSDNFYQYGPLYGDAACSDGSTYQPGNGSCSGGGQVGYFGNKVLAVSYGGTLQLAGYKGTTDDPNLAPGSAGLTPGASNPAFGSNAANSGNSWIRLKDGSSLQTGATSLTLEHDPSGRWTAGDEIVVTTTDYLPGHSEQLEIATGYTTGAQIPFSGSPQNPGSVTTIQWPHNGVRYGGQSTVDGNQPWCAKVNTDGTCDPAGGGRLQRRILSSIDPTLAASGAETRAAVTLLSRSIKIVSAGDTAGSTFPVASTPAPCLTTADPGPCYYSYGGHMIIRQGFQAVQISGVEFKQMGQGGLIGHYPVHFHMARKTPANTYIVNSSVNESMTRWYVIHATLGVTLARNVGYMSIGHGYYLEAGPETDNNFFSNIGILSRGAVKNPQNPRKIPGILASNVRDDTNGPAMPYRSDIDFPTVFWITNGWNDFIGNMAAGATTCGAGYWLTPAANAPNGVLSDVGSLTMQWSGYSSLQGLAGFTSGAYAGTTPLKSFFMNYATSSMHSFQDAKDATNCHDLGVFEANPAGPPADPVPPSATQAIMQAPWSVAPKPTGTTTGPDFTYYPLIAGALVNGARRVTYCDSTGPNNCATSGNPPACGTPGYGADSILDHCGAVVLDHFTSSFHWAEGNFSAIWLRPQWSLLVSSVLTDVQNGGLSLITGGDYTHSSVIDGYWGLSDSSIFVGHSRKDMKTYYFASDIGPFNTDSYNADNIHNKCDQSTDPTAYCLNSAQGVTYPTGSFFGNQRINNFYDGPTFEDSNAYLDINTSPCSLNRLDKPAWNTDCMYGTGASSLLLRSSPLLPTDPITRGPCYVPNAAIGWKSPNGFYYPPAFHSTNLQFDNVDIRHYVIQPLFQAPPGVTGSQDFGQGGTYTTDQNRANQQYCILTGSAGSFFTNFTSIDRQTELNDDDGSLTGLVNSVTGNPRITQTISVNEDIFFNAPVETAECASAPGKNSLPQSATCPPTTDPKSPPQTVKTSPYDYVSTVLWPRGSSQSAGDTTWSNDCSTPSCYGVPLYRQYLTGMTGAGATREWNNWFNNGCSSSSGLTKPQCRWPFMRMAGTASVQRQTMTVNNGLYYLDTSISAKMQTAENAQFTFVNQFLPNNQYTVFLVYAKNTTKQTYQIYVGNNKAKFSPTRVGIESFPLVFKDQSGTWAKLVSIDPNGIMTVNIDLSSATDLQPSPAQGLCQPREFCCASTDGKTCDTSGSASASKCIGNLKSTDPIALANPNMTAEAGYICENWAMKDLDCPKATFKNNVLVSGGCYGFSITLPDDFMADGLANQANYRPAPQPFPEFGGTQLAPLGGAPIGRRNSPTRRLCPIARAAGERARTRSCLTVPSASNRGDWAVTTETIGVAT